jgi:hypothetical protein
VVQAVGTFINEINRGGTSSGRRSSIPSKSVLTACCFVADGGSLLTWTLLTTSSVPSSSSNSVFSRSASSSVDFIFNPLVNPGGIDGSRPNCVFSLILYRFPVPPSSAITSRPPGENGNCPVRPRTKSSFAPGLRSREVEFFPVRSFSTAVYYKSVVEVGGRRDFFVAGYSAL